MKIKSAFAISLALLFALFTFVPARSYADIILDVPSTYSTPQLAIDFGNSQFLASGSTGTKYIVAVAPGTYSGGIELKTGISSLQGEETARTIISGVTGTFTAAVTANALPGVVTFIGFTVINAPVGILVNNTEVHITNNVFANDAVANTGVQILGASSAAANVVNNTFFQNSTAVSTDQDVQIANNIFSNNTRNISLASASKVSANCFFPLPTLPNTDPTGSGPITESSINFVAISSRDFHLTQASLCTNASTTQQFGAFGGSNSDNIPFPVSILNASLESASSITISWSQNLAFDVTGQTTPVVPKGHYNIHFKFGESGSETTLSTLDSTITSTIISGLTVTAAAPAAPILYGLRYADQRLILNWTPVLEATGYIIHYEDLTAGTGVQTVEAGNVFTYVLAGLTNGHEYRVSVQSFTQAAYFFSVTAVDYTGNESDRSPEAVVRIGDIAESSESNPLTESPDRLAAAPDLPNKGCFIATAAYGSYSAAQVQALRDFRDRYLVTNSPGRAFVDWYYRYGPIGARYMNEHAWTKPVVRIALLPAVGTALFLVHAPAELKIAVLLIMTFLSLNLWFRKDKNVCRKEAQEAQKKTG